MQACQKQCLNWTAAMVPGFVYGMNADQIKEYCTAHGVKSHWKSICIDGKSFDSS
jgi:hypothetical protein